MNTASIADTSDADGLVGPRRVWAVAAVLGAMVLVVVDAAIANVALPSIGRSLHIAPALAVRVITAYQLGLMTMLLPAAAFAESLGFRRVFAAGAALFTGASVLCALSPSVTWLIAARFVQGLGGAAIMALGVALLRSVVPQARLGAAIGWNALTVALSSAAGPGLGTMILSVAPWPWLFAVNLPIGAAVLAAAQALPRATGTGRSVNWISIALNVSTFALLVVAAERAASRPMLALALLMGAVASATALVRQEAARPAPMIPLDLLAQRPFRVSVIASVLCFAGQAAGLVALPFYLQHALGLTFLMTGIYLTLWPLTVALAGPVAGRLADRVSTAWLCLVGGLLLAFGLGAAAVWPVHGQSLLFGLCTMLCGLGFGLFNVANNRSMFLSAPRERSGAAGGLQGVARLTGQTAGAVMMSLLFELSPLDIASRIGLAIGALLTLAAGLTSLLRSAPLEKVSP